jgi:hypothetical protein
MLEAVKVQHVPSKSAMLQTSKNSTHLQFIAANSGDVPECLQN